MRDKDSRGLDQRLMQTKAGDVVVIVPDGHQWGREEVSNPDWRVLQLPGLAAEALSDTTEIRMNERNGRPTARRLRYFDVSDEWLRGVLASGQVIQFTDGDAARLLGLRRVRNDDLPVMVG